jgi:zinc transport system substrate-binding protein
MVDTSRKFKDRYIKTDEAVTHSHGPEGKHAHEDIAFTIWLDFDVAAGQAKAITDALSRKRPILKDTFQKNYTALAKDLKELDRQLKEIISQDNTRPLVVSHPVYDYLAHRYGLNIRSVHWEPDEVPGNAKLIELRNILKNHPAQWMIWEGKPLSSSVEKLKSIGVRSIVFDPCGNVPEQGDFLGVMRMNIKNLKKVYR